MDDTYVQLEKYEEFLDWLRRKPKNPTKEPMAFGNCLSWGPGTYYLQGGSGYIFSRKAAEKMIELEDWWIKTMDLAEDNHLWRFFQALNISGPETACPYFAGHFLPHKQYKIMLSKKLRLKRKWPTCPDNIEIQPECNQGLMPYQNVVFSHAWKPKMSHEEWRYWFTRIPNNAMFYFDRLDLKLCRRT